MKCPECGHKTEKDKDSGVKCPNCGHWIPEFDFKDIPDYLVIGRKQYTREEAVREHCLLLKEKKE